jgi:DNA-binding transcriptional regulator YiaG
MSGMKQSPLKEWRGKRTQDEAARLLGVNAMTYSRWERGVHLPRKSKWPVIKEMTGLPLEQVLEFSGEAQ